VMIKNFLFAVAAALLCIFFFRQKIAVWTVFLVATFYYTYLIFRKKENFVTPITSTKSITPGELGTFEVDGDDCFGLYLRLCGWDVFVDIREDEQLEARKIRARALFENTSLLERNLEEFINCNARFKNSVINSIGLHAPNIDQCEVFWDPEGYTLIKGFSFIAE
jgi:hypothetical protein